MVNFVLVARPANYYPLFEEYSAREQALCYYSDTFKEAHGFRPRHISHLATAGQIARAEKACIRMIEMERQREMEVENQRKERVRARNERNAQGFTLGARWP